MFNFGKKKKKQAEKEKIVREMINKVEHFIHSNKEALGLIDKLGIKNIQVEKLNKNDGHIKEFICVILEKEDNDEEPYIIPIPPMFDFTVEYIKPAILGSLYSFVGTDRASRLNTEGYRCIKFEDLIDYVRTESRRIDNKVTAIALLNITCNLYQTITGTPYTKVLKHGREVQLVLSMSEKCIDLSIHEYNHIVEMLIIAIGKIYSMLEADYTNFKVIEKQDYEQYRDRMEFPIPVIVQE